MYQSPIPAGPRPLLRDPQPPPHPTFTRRLKINVSLIVNVLAARTIESMFPSIAFDYVSLCSPIAVMATVCISLAAKTNSERCDTGVKLSNG